MIYTLLLEFFYHEHLLINLFVVSITEIYSKLNVMIIIMYFSVRLRIDA